MTIFVKVKSPGARRHLSALPVELPSVPLTLEELMEQIVRENVAAYNAKRVDADVVALLTQESIETQGATGKVGFGRRFGGKAADVTKSVEAAVLAFQDGLYRVFIDEQEATDLQGALQLRDGAEVVFLRFTFLAGRMW